MRIEVKVSKNNPVDRSIYKNENVVQIALFVCSVRNQEYFSVKISRTFIPLINFFVLAFSQFIETYSQLSVRKKRKSSATLVFNKAIPVRCIFCAYKLHKKCL